MTVSHTFSCQSFAVILIFHIWKLSGPVSVGQVVVSDMRGVGGFGKVFRSWRFEVVFSSSSCDSDFWLLGNGAHNLLRIDVC